MGPAAEQDSVSKNSVISAKNTDGKLTQCDTLANTDDASSGKEACNVATRRKALHECSSDDQDASSGHSDLATQKVGNGTAHEEAANNCTHGVGRVDTSNHVLVRVIEVGHPIVRALYGIINGRIVTV